MKSSIHESLDDSELFEAPWNKLSILVLGSVVQNPYDAAWKAYIVFYAVADQYLQKAGHPLQDRRNHKKVSALV